MTTPKYQRKVQTRIIVKYKLNVQGGERILAKTNKDIGYKDLSRRMLTKNNNFAL